MERRETRSWLCFLTISFEVGAIEGESVDDSKAHYMTSLCTAMNAVATHDFLRYVGERKMLHDAREGDMAYQLWRFLRYMNGYYAERCAPKLIIADLYDTFASMIPVFLVLSPLPFVIGLNFPQGAYVLI